MKLLKRMVAVALIMLMVFSFAGCHKKDEIAVTIGGIEFTSAYYMNALINADSEAKSKVEEGLSEDELMDEDFDYYKQKIDGKKYADWVKDRAIDELKNVAAYRLLCKENEIVLTEDAKNSVDQNANIYWSYYGYGTLLEPNGVGYETFKKVMEDRYYSDLYFDHLYAEGGKEEIPQDEMNKVYGETFILADVLQFDYTKEDGSKMSDKEIEDVKNEVNAYANDIRSGKMTFEEVYDEVTKEDESQTTETDNNEELKPVYPHATVLGDKETVYESEDFDTVKKMAVGEVKVIDNSTYEAAFLYVKRDIFADEYHMNNIESTVRHHIKDDDFQKLIDEYKEKLEIKISNYATKRFKIEKIVYPQTAY